jgi:hypothetical protein
MVCGKSCTYIRHEFGSSHLCSLCCELILILRWEIFEIRLLMSLHSKA